MAKTLLLNTLSDLFGDYVVGLSKENLKVGVFKGKIELNDLQLNENSVNELQLPLTVLHGSVEKFLVDIPWLALDKEPVKVEIAGVNLLVGPIQQGGWDDKEVKKRRLEIKKMQLASAEKEFKEKLEKAGQKTNKKEEGDINWVEGLVMKIVDNLQIKIKDVHIRYEDAVSSPGRLMAAGITLDALRVHTTDAEWREIFLDRTKQENRAITIVRKLLRMERLAVYFDTGRGEGGGGGGGGAAPPLRLGDGRPAGDVRALMKSLICRVADEDDEDEEKAVAEGQSALDRLSLEELAGAGDAASAAAAAAAGGLRYVVAPLSATAQLLHNTAPGGRRAAPPGKESRKKRAERVAAAAEEAEAARRPVYDLSVAFTPLRLRLGRDQYQAVFEIKKHFEVLLQWQLMYPHRPRTSPREDPRAWWRYAYKFVTYHRTQLSQLVEVVEARKPFIELHMRAEGCPKMEPLPDSGPDRDRYNDYLDRLPVQSLVIFRYQAGLQAADARAKQRELKQATEEVPWWQFWDREGEEARRKERREKLKGGGGGGGGEDWGEDVAFGTLVRQGMDAVQEAAEAADQRRLPPDFVLYQVNVHATAAFALHDGRDELVRSAGGFNAGARVLASKDMQVTFDTNQLEVEDRCTPSPAQPYLVATYSAALAAAAAAPPPLPAHAAATAAAVSPKRSASYRDHDTPSGMGMPSHGEHAEEEAELGSVSSSAGGEEDSSLGSVGEVGAAGEALDFDPVLGVVVDIGADQNISVALRLRPLMVSYNKGCVERLLSTFAVPPSLTERLLVVAERTVEGVSEQAQRAARAGGSTLQVSVEASAPKVVVPYRPSDPRGGFLFLDMGELKVEGGTLLEDRGRTLVRPDRPMWRVAIDNIQARMLETLAELGRAPAGAGPAKKGQTPPAPPPPSYLIAPFQVDIGLNCDDKGPNGAYEADMLLEVEILSPIKGDITNLELFKLLKILQRLAPMIDQAGAEGILEQERDATLDLNQRSASNADALIKALDRDALVRQGSFSGVDAAAKQMGINVSVASVCLNLVLDDPSLGVRRAARFAVAADRFGLRLAKRVYDMDLAIRLAAVSITDLRPEYAGLPQLLRSETPSPAAAASSDGRAPAPAPERGGEEALVEIGLRMFDSKMAPAFGGYKMEIDVRFSTLEMDINPDRLLDIKPFYLALVGQGAGLEAEGWALPEAKEEEVMPGLERGMSALEVDQAARGLRQKLKPLREDEVQDSMKVNIDIKTVGFGLMRNDKMPIVHMSIDGCGVGVVIPGPDDVRCDVRLRSFDILDRRPKNEKNKIRKLVGPKALLSEQRIVLPGEEGEGAAGEDSDSSGHGAEPGEGGGVAGPPPPLLLVEFRGNDTMAGVKVVVAQLEAWVVLETVLEALEYSLKLTDNVIKMLGIADDAARRKEAALAQRAASMAAAVPPPASRDDPKDQADGGVPPEKTLDVHVDVAEPKLLLVEDAARKSTKALVLRAGVQVTLRSQQWPSMNRQSDTLQVTVHDLESFVDLDLSLKDSNPVQVLEPLSLMYRVDTEAWLGEWGEARPFSVSTTLYATMLDARVSFRDILLVNNVITSATAGLEESKPKRDEDDEDDDSLDLQAGRGGGGGGGDGDGGFALGAPTSPTGGHADRPGSGLTAAVTQSIRLNAQNVRVIIINDFDSQDQPVIRASIQDVHFTMDGAPTTFEGKGSFKVHVDFYNHEVAAWEPLLEEWEPEIEVNNDGISGALKLTLTCRELLMVNLSGEFLQMIMSTHALLFWSSEGDQSQGARGHNVPYLVVNETGLPLRLNKANQKQDWGFMEIQPGERASVEFVSARQKSPNDQEQVQRFVALALGGEWAGSRKWIGDLPLSEAGTALYSWDPVEAPPPERAQLYAGPVAEEAYQFQRYDPLGRRWKAPFLPLDKAEFMDKQRHHPRDPATVELADPDNWVWLDEWHVDASARGLLGRADGWEYAADFSSFTRGYFPRGMAEGDAVRRRRHVRCRAPRPPARADPGRPLALCWEVEVGASGRTVATARSALRLENRTAVPFQVEGRAAGAAAGDPPRDLGLLNSQSHLNVGTLDAYLGLFQFKPAGAGRPEDWSDEVSVVRLPYANGQTTKLVCRSADGRDLHLLAHLHFPSATGPAALVLLPPYTLLNRLPCALRYLLGSKTTTCVEAASVGPAEARPLTAADNSAAGFGPTLSLRVGNYQFSSVLPLAFGGDGIEARAVQLPDGAGRDLALRVELRPDLGGSVQVEVSCPYWVADRTGLGLFYGPGGGLRAAAPPAGALDAELARPLELQNFEAHSTHEYHIRKLRPGVPAYSDRSFQWAEVPPYLEHQFYIQTSAEDRGGDGGGDGALLLFTVTADARVFVLHDARAEVPPLWLLQQEFIKVENETITITEKGYVSKKEIVWAVYYKEFPAGTLVVLGHNRMPGAQRMYAVAVADAALGPPPGAAAAAELAAGGGGGGGGPGRLRFSSAGGASELPPQLSRVPTGGAGDMGAALAVMKASQRFKRGLKGGEGGGGGGGGGGRGERMNSFVEQAAEALDAEQQELVANAWAMGDDRTKAIRLFSSEGKTIAVGCAEEGDSQTYWSKNLDIDVNNYGTFDLEVGTKRYDLQVISTRCPAPFGASTLVEFMPRYMIANFTEFTAEVKQVGTRRAFELPPDGAAPFHFQSMGNPLQVLLRLQVNGQALTDWSEGGFSPDASGSTCVALPLAAVGDGDETYSPHAAMVVNVEVRLAAREEGCAVLVVLWAARRRAQHLYRVENRSPWAAWLWQEGADPHRALVIPGFQDVEFGWALPTGAKKVVLQLQAEGPRTAKDRVEVELDKINARRTIKLAPKPGVEFDPLLHRASAAVRVSGGTKVLRLAAGPLPDAGWEEGRWDDPAKMVTFEAQLAGVSVSLVRGPRGRREILAASLAANPAAEPAEDDPWRPGVSVQLILRPSQTSLIFEVDHMQVDNYMAERVFDVMLAPSPQKEPKAKKGQEIEERFPQPFLSVILGKSNAPSGAAVCFEYFQVRLLEFEVLVDRGSLVALGAFLAPLRLVDAAEAVAARSPRLWVATTTRRYLARLAGRAGGGLDLAAARAAAVGQRVYFAALILHPVKLQVTFVQNPVDPADAYVGVNVLSILAEMVSLDHAQIKLKSFGADYVMETPEGFGRTLTAFYVRQLSSQVLKIAGSISMLGSPADLLSNIGTGVGDFFYEPYDGLMLGPSAFAKGVKRGATSLVKNVVHGAFNSLAGVGGGAVHGLGALTFDQEFQQERERRKNRRLAERGGFRSGVAQGARNLGSGVVAGLTGVVAQPVRGARQGGLGGFVRGVGKGLVGVVVKPLVGVGDAGVSVLEGVSQGALGDTLYRPLRRRRALDLDPRSGKVVLTPYSALAASAQEVATEQAPGDAYEGFLALTASWAVFTDRRLVVVLRATAERQFYPWHEIAFYDLPGEHLVEVHLPDGASVPLHCAGPEQTEELLARLAPHGAAMSQRGRNHDPRRAPRDWGRRAVETRSLQDQDFDKTSYARKLTYRWGEINGTHLPYEALDKDAIINHARDALPKLNSDDWPAIDNVVWRLISEWKDNHTGFGVRKCIAVVIVNLSSVNIQLRGVDVTSGRLHETLPGPRYSEAGRTLLPQGSVVVFAYGHRAKYVSKSTVELTLETDSFSGTISNRSGKALLQPAPGYQVDVLEASMEEKYCKFVIGVSK